MEERALAEAMGEWKVCPKMAVCRMLRVLPSTSSSSSSVASPYSPSSSTIGGSTSNTYIRRPPPTTSIGQNLPLPLLKHITPHL